MSGYKVDLRDIRFVLEEQIGIQDVARDERFDGLTWEDFEMVIGEAERFSREVIHPLQEVVDTEGIRFEGGRVKMPKLYHDVYRAYCKAGWGGVAVNPELGGQGLPHTLGALSVDLFIGACPSFAFVPGLAHAAARVIETVGTPQQVEHYCERMFTGVWGGTMCLTEPHAGSAVGDLRTAAVKAEGEDYYLISGDKNFISAGDQDLTENIVHLVLARTPGASPGIKGVSLFIVPTVRLDGQPNDVAVTALEEKMGIHGSPTVSLSFGDEADCRGWILGGEGEGIRHMFIMMNEARLAVGLQASSIANFAYRLALDYAKERIQGVDVKAMKDPTAERVPIIRHPDVRRMLMTMKAYAEGCRALTLKTASLFDFAEIAETEKERQKLMNLVEILTPICKAYASYRSFETADLAIMIHGGYGYIREYKVEGLLRDVKIAAIYEGTNGIQALDLLGRKVARKGGLMFMGYIQWLNELIQANRTNDTLAPMLKQFEAAKNTLAAVTMELGQKSMKGDLYYPVLQASPYLEMFGDVTFARLLIEQAALATVRLAGELTDGERRFYAGKLATATYFTNTHLPRVEMLATVIRNGDRSPLEMDF